MSSALNVVQIEANRRNAGQSTGPRTETGKKTSSLNALRHGLTARVVVLPTEDLAAYKRFSEEFLASLAPETFVERQFAQTVIDTQWRLNRVRTLEDGMLGLGHFGPECQIDPGHPEIHAALSAAAVYREHSQAFVNLSMHEQRLYRILKDALKSLEEMKATRIAARELPNSTREISNIDKREAIPDETPPAGFVFTGAEIETDGGPREAGIAPDCNDTTGKNSVGHPAATIITEIDNACDR